MCSSECGGVTLIIAKNSCNSCHTGTAFCRELSTTIICGALSADHVHMFVSIPPSVSAYYFMQRVKGRSSHRVQQEFPELRKRYWGRRFWSRGYFCTTSGSVTDGIILQYIEKHALNQPGQAGSGLAEITLVPSLIAVSLASKHSRERQDSG